MAVRRLQVGVDTEHESLLGASSGYPEFGTLPGASVGGYQDIGGYNETSQYRPDQVQSPFSQQPQDPGYQPMKY